ncbi:hypothetical protein ILUMI_01887 [Ignelater luminosus]|uniref:Conserved oligomeric Golgi complex subunit 1 n=1 Tax=Ignelater luminosus TaxID=2038154 RepID=A0A8K0DEG8_IGNLU|nr:hypothetical protein ILUMI_01887 [Ignelater luminosus]
MANVNSDLLALDIDKLFEEHSISEIIEIEKLLDAEIEKKRVELRGMVGDRYKDVLTASDAIKSMKSTSEKIVESIQEITDRCESLIVSASTPCKKRSSAIDPKTLNERTIVMQIRLAMVVNNQIWMALEEEDFSKAAQIYLLAQHIHTGLQLLSKDTLEKLPILKRMKSDIDILRNRILKRAKEKLKTVELSVEETSSNLNALMLLERYQNDLELLNVFIELRKTALSMVINEPHISVRVQVTAMLKCLVTTVHLLHQCFINYKNTKRGLIWQQLESIVSDDAPATLTKVNLPLTPLVVYITDIIKQFRPKWNNNIKFESSTNQIPIIVKNWLSNTADDIKKGLEHSLELITNIKGLHIIREESLKIELPKNWDVICSETNLPTNFHVWYYFFQALITARAKILISKKVSANSISLQDSIEKTLSDAMKTEPFEGDLRWYTWKEEEGDVSRTENKHLGLSMKTKGYSSNIVQLCAQLDRKYLELLEDVSLYLYGIEHTNVRDDIKLPIIKEAYDKKFVDRNEVEEFLKSECSTYSYKLTSYLEKYTKSENDQKVYVIKSLICARFLQALCELCPSLNKCCSSDNKNDEWERICTNFVKSSLQFYRNWLNSCTKHTELLSNELRDVSVLNMLHILPKWEKQEIQEQTDEKIFKSQIKIPSQPSLSLQKILAEVSNQMSAVIPHTLPRQIHLRCIEENIQIILNQYEYLADSNLNQTQALQFLFDVKYITTLCIPRENLQLVSKSQSICDKFRSKIDPFDLDVFYSYLQNNVKMCVLQSQVILGCLLPSSGHLASLGMFEKTKDLEKEPSVLAVSIPSSASWFPLLPVTAPVQKISSQTITTSKNDFKSNSVKPSDSVKKPPTSVSSVRSGAAAFFGGLTNDWFS